MNVKILCKVSGLEEKNYMDWGIRKHQKEVKWNKVFKDKLEFETEKQKGSRCKTWRHNRTWKSRAWLQRMSVWRWRLESFSGQGGPQTTCTSCFGPSLIHWMVYHWKTNTKEWHGQIWKYVLSHHLQSLTAICLNYF